MRTFRNTYDNKTLAIAGEFIKLTIDGDPSITMQPHKTDLPVIAASILELYGAPEKASTYGSASVPEDYANSTNSDEILLWQAYARLHALGIRAEYKAAQEAEALQKEHK